MADMNLILVTSKLNTGPSTEKYDALRATVGDFGRWQLKISILMALTKFPVAWFQMSIVFLAPPTKFWCKKWREYENMTTGEELTRPGYEGAMQDSIHRGYCFMKPHILNYTKSGNLVPCEEYSYNNSLFSSTITSEWNLVCDKQKLTDFSQVSLMLGVLLGNIVFGMLADKHGRKKILLICLLLQSILGIFASIAPFFWLFILLRCFLALANGGTMVTSFVMCMEVVGGKWRTIVPILYQIPFGFGYALLSGIAYFLRDWRNLHLAISLFSMFYIILFWLVPESPRWLLAVGRHEEALLILKNVAKENKILNLDIDRISTNLSNENTYGQESKVNIKALFLTKKIRRRSYLLCINWLMAGVTFYAFIQHMGHVTSSNNLFLTVALGGLISIPGTILCIFIVGNYGRRLTITYSFILSAASSLLILAFPKGVYVVDWPRVMFAGICIIGLSVSIPAMYLFTGELYPTVIRNSGVGFAMMFSRLGSMIAPLIISLQTVASFLPLLVIGIVTIIQAVLILPLPETQDRPLPDAIEDLENEKHVSRQDGTMRLNQLSCEAT